MSDKSSKLKPIPDRGDALPIRHVSSTVTKRSRRSSQQISADRWRISEMLMRNLSIKEIIAIQKNKTDCTVAMIRSDIDIVKQQMREGAMEASRVHVVRNLFERSKDLEDIKWIEAELKKAWEVSSCDPDGMVDTSIMKTMLQAKKLKHNVMESMIDNAALLQLPTAAEELDSTEFVARQREAITMIDRRPSKIDKGDFPNVRVLPKVSGDGE